MFYDTYPRFTSLLGRNRVLSRAEVDTFLSNEKTIRRHSRLVSGVTILTTETIHALHYSSHEIISESFALNPIQPMVVKSKWLSPTASVDY